MGPRRRAAACRGAAALLYVVRRLASSPRSRFSPCPATSPPRLHPARRVHRQRHRIPCTELGRAAQPAQRVSARPPRRDVWGMAPALLSNGGASRRCYAAMALFAGVATHVADAPLEAAPLPGERSPPTSLALPLCLSASHLTSLSPPTPRRFQRLLYPAEDAAPAHAAVPVLFGRTSPTGAASSHHPAHRCARPVRPPASTCSAARAAGGRALTPPPPAADGSRALTPLRRPPPCGCFFMVGFTAAGLPVCRRVPISDAMKPRRDGRRQGGRRLPCLVVVGALHRRRAAPRAEAAMGRRIVPHGGARVRVRDPERRLPDDRDGRRARDSSLQTPAPVSAPVFYACIQLSLGVFTASAEGDGAARPR